MMKAHARPTHSLFVLLLLGILAPPLHAGALSKRARLFPVGPNPSAIAAKDLNGDGLPEIITADRGPMTDPREERPANDELSLLIAQDALDYVRHHPSLKTGFAPYDIALANIDALKWPDIIVAGFMAVRHRDISLFLNIKHENLFKPVEFRIPDEALSYCRFKDGDGVPLFTVPGLTAIAVSDLNHDGLRDLIATGWSCDVLVFLPGHAQTYFGTPQFIPAAGAPVDIELADFDADGYTDLAVALYATGEIALFKGDAQAQYREVGRFPTRGRLPTKLKVSDINDDGRADLIVSHCHTDDAIVVFYGDGAFSFSVSQEIVLGSDREVLEHEIRDLAVADFDGNQRPDIAAACYASGRVAVLLNQTEDRARSRDFREESYSFEKARPRALCVADFDRNGRDDLAVALWDADAVGLLLGTE